METQTTNSVGQQGATTGRLTPTAGPGFKVLFGFREVCNLTRLSRPTLKYWILRGWVRPVGRSRGGRGREHQFSAWQTIGLSILSAALRSAEQAHTQVGRVGVVSAMEALAGLDDSLLLADDRQDPYTTETVAAEIARAASPDLPVECLEGMARVLEAVDRKVQGMRNRVARRVAGQV